MFEQTVDIVKLIEKNPITRLSKNYQNKLIKKIKLGFNDSQQQLFVASFFCYLNYDCKNDFLVDLDDIWKWIGFSRKDPAKVVLKKNFMENIDYKIISQRSLGNSESDRGRPMEQILMTINTFKKFCLKANTKKSDEIHEYYIKLEEILHETIDEETADLKKQLLEKDEELLIKDEQNNYKLKKQKHDMLVNLLKTKKCVYVGEIEENKLIKIGSSKHIDGRSYSLGREYDNDIIFLEIFECENFREIEENILNNSIIKQHLCKKIIRSDGKKSKEVVELTESFTYEKFISIIKKHVTKINDCLTPVQILEKQKLDQEKEKIDLEKQKMDLEKYKLDHDLLLAIMKNSEHVKEFKEIISDNIQHTFKNINIDIKNAPINIEKMNQKLKQKKTPQIQTMML